MIDYRISGLPVVDADGKLIGMVTEHDFLRQHDGTRRHWLDVLFADAGGQITARELHDRCIANVMSRGPISVHAETPIEEPAELMHRHRIKRLPVVAGGADAAPAAIDVLRGVNNIRCRCGLSKARVRAETGGGARKVGSTMWVYWYTRLFSG